MTTNAATTEHRTVPSAVPADPAAATASSATVHGPGRPVGHSVSAGLLLLRVVLGITFVMHGWQKVSEWGLDGTMQSFEGMGIPAPALSAVFAVVVELVGGLALILGVFTRIAGVLLAVDMLGALFLVHATSGFFSATGGIELVLLLAAASLALSFTGPGRYAVAALLPGRRSVGVLA